MSLKGRIFTDSHKKKLHDSHIGKRFRTEAGEESFTQKMKGQNNSRWNRKIICCNECGDYFLVQAYRKDSAKFCSRACASQYRNTGKTPANEKLRKSAAYKAWRTLVFERDDYTCQICLKRGGELHADHILPFALYPNLRLDVDNGRTLCVECHKQTETFGIKLVRKMKVSNLAVLDNF